jgi:hypothetical protein
VFTEAGGWSEVADHRDLLGRDRFVTPAGRPGAGMTTYDVREGAEPTAGSTPAVSALRRGELAVLPTDTVYGIAADAFSPPAVVGCWRPRAAAATCRCRSWSARGGPSTASPSW